MCFAPRRRYRPRDGEAGGERSLTVRAQDAEGGWHVRLADGGAVGTVGTAASRMDSRDDPAADCTLEGPAAGLYAFLWNRCDAARAGLVITGRPETLAVWNASVRVRW